MAASPASAVGSPDARRFDGTRLCLAWIDVVLLALALIFVATGGLTQPGWYLGACFAYAGWLLASRLVPDLARHARDNPLPGVVVMLVFSSAVLAFSGDPQASLRDLCLLPIIVAALTLGRGALGALVVLALLARLAIAWLAAGPAVQVSSDVLGLLIEGVPVALAAILINTLALAATEARAQLQLRADRDDLTGLLNLQAFTRLVAQERERAIQRGTDFSVLLVDIDDLKLLNARLGPEAGDRALVAVAEALRRSTRSVDLVARYGGDEFILFLSGADAAIAKGVANRIRHNVGTMTVEADSGLQRVTVGIGAGVFPVDGRELRDLTNVAGRAIDKDKVDRRPSVRPVVAQAGARVGTGSA